MKGVHYLHKEKNIIHRDLKSNNILIDDDYNPVICDFGLSIKITDREICNGIQGSFPYLAPEVFFEKDYSFEVDIWALGVIFYELFLEVLPFDDKSQFTILKDIIEKNIDLTRFSKKEKAFVEACLEID